MKKEISQPQKPFNIKSADWNSPEAAAIRSIRIKVFVEEQNVPLAEEFDATDLECFHVLAYDEQGLPCGTGRLYSDAGEPDLAHIGRMAVLAGARGKGCGAAIMQALILEAKTRGFGRIVLSAQTHAMRFYEKLGFKSFGDIYPDVGIPHINMIKYERE